MSTVASLAAPASTPLADAYGRRIRYLRMSVTDRCDLRCRYCMPQGTRFLPAHDLLTFDELDRITQAFMRRGLERLRLTGGEPLVRRGVLELINRLGGYVRSGALSELTLTTNGTRLAAFAAALAAAGVRRVNVSLDSLDADRFRHITRGGDLAQVLAGIDAAAAAGLQVKLNMVALRGVNDHEIEPMLRFAHARGHALTLIETMPVGAVEEDRTAHFLPLQTVKRRLAERFTLTPVAHRTGGPARYVRVAETGGLLGFITPLTHNFCEDCNRVRLTASGKLYLCLGHEDAADLRAAVREQRDDPAALDRALAEAVARKPRAHDFRIAPGAAPAVRRTMSVTGG